MTEKARTIIRNDKVWWILKDVCNILGTANQASTIYYSNNPLAKPSYKMRGATFLASEVGVYRLFLSGRLPRSRRWHSAFVNYILPAIRRNGYYKGEIPDEIKVLHLLDQIEQSPEEFKQATVRVFMKDEKPWWSFNDIFKYFFGPREGRARHIKRIEKQNWFMTFKFEYFINENGLFEYLLNPRKQHNISSKQKDRRLTTTINWIIKEMLPSIRGHEFDIPSEVNEILEALRLKEPMESLRKTSILIEEKQLCKMN